MTGRLLRTGAAGLALCTGLGVLSGCTAAKQTAGYLDPKVPSGSFQLVAFDSCDDALGNLRAAALSVVGPYGLGGGPIAAFDMARGGAPVPAMGAPNAAADKAGSAAEGTTQHSTTNTHEVGVDEPDLVKTDGRRIVTLTGGVLRVIDAASHTVTGTLRLTDALGPSDRKRASYMPEFMAGNLLLAGDHVLVLTPGSYSYAYRGGIAEPAVEVAPPMPDSAGAADPGTTGEAADELPPGAPGRPKAPGAAPGASTPVGPQPIVGPRMLLIDISGKPTIMSQYAIDGSLVDARQVGSTARVVLRSAPRITFPYTEKGTDATRTEANKKIIQNAKLDEWLPRIEVTTNGTTDKPAVACDAISRPANYTGANLVTVLTFDLAAGALDDGKPTVLVADGDTIYSNGPSLYVASDQRWQVQLPGGALPDAAEPRTEIYKFDTPGGGRPTFVAGGSVPGYLINQYAMSEWDGNLRVATTTGQPWLAPGEKVPSSSSGVYVLASTGKKLRQLGSVTGLGKGERIYAVRFTGPVGYVVTFRQTDPLYTVDLRDPARPTVRGELKISGYSAYLHPIDGQRLIGVGQEATKDGRTTGTQVSLFNVADLNATALVGRYTVSGAHSAAEFDPHAFLYWQPTGLLVLPLEVYNPGPVPMDKPGAAESGSTGTGSGSSGSGGSSASVSSPTVPNPGMPRIGALLLRVHTDATGANAFSEAGFVSHPSPYGDYATQIQRSLMIGQTLWTVSDAGILATDGSTLRRQDWIPFSQIR